MSLLEEVKKFPHLPGVYIMKDAEGTVIYIGKAKDLNKRVRNYFQGREDRYQIKFLMKRVTAVEKIVVASEEQALILERDLINKFKPKYNIRLKDDKAYLSIRIDLNAEWPRMELVRKVHQDGASYFGPYTSAYEVRQLVDVINRVVPVRSCTNTVLHNRQRPCLEHQIKRCLAPCCLEVDEQEYRDCVKQAVSILEGKTKGVIERLNRQMEVFSKELCFEEAAAVRDRIEVLESFRKGQGATSSGTGHRDVFFIYREEKLAVLSVMNVRYGRVSNNNNFVLQDLEISDEEILESALEQYYRGAAEVPEEIVIPCEFENISLIREFLKKQRGATLDLTVPQRGVKFRLLKLAELNARQHFSATFDSERRYQELATKLARMLKLDQVPREVECVDISNLQGSDIVGAVVNFYDGEPQKKMYKRYKISFQDKPDDFAAIEEVVYRRLKRGMQEDSLPDLLVIDGGKGQLRSALKAREELKLNTAIVAIAKERGESKKIKVRKEERLVVPWQEASLPLQKGEPVTNFLTRIRDEVHRFVITFHREKRAVRVMKSVFDEVPGIGPQRRKRLLDHFGSVKKIGTGSSEEVAMVAKMPVVLAEKLLKKL